MRWRRRAMHRRRRECPRSPTTPVSAYMRCAPGVYSARYAQLLDGGEKSDAANNARLVKDLANESDRRAYFFSVLVLVRHAADPQPVIAEGRWHGELIDTPGGEH